MKAVFAHDHKFYRFEGLYYSNGSFSKEILKRYTDSFEKLNILSRQIELDEFKENLTLSSGPNINFTKIPDLNSMKRFNNYKEANGIIDEQVKNADFVIIRLPSTIGKLATKYAKKYNKPYIIEVVGCAWDTFINHGNLLGKIIAPYEYLSQRYYIKNSPYTIYITKEFLQNRYPTEGISEVCPNVNINSVNSSILEQRLVKIKKNRNILKFGLIGSLDVDYKGHEVLLKALSKVKKDLPDFEVDFVGGGNPQRWEVLINELELSKNINFVGTIPNGEKIYEWMDNLDVYFQPSSAEAQGRSIIESMSRGCPVIASRVGGIVEIIDNEFLIESGDHISLSSMIIKMLDEKIMTNQAIKNFEKSKTFYKPVIDEKRKKFFKKVVDYS